MRLNHLFACLFMMFGASQASDQAGPRAEDISKTSSRLEDVSADRTLLAKALIKMNPEFAGDKPIDSKPQTVKFILLKDGKEKNVTIAFKVSFTKIATTDRIKLHDFECVDKEALELLGSAYSLDPKDLKDLALRLFIFAHTGEGKDIQLSKKTYYKSMTGKYDSAKLPEIVINPVLRLSKTDKGMQATYSDLEADFVKQCLSDEKKKLIWARYVQGIDKDIRNAIMLPIQIELPFKKGLKDISIKLLPNYYNGNQNARYCQWSLGINLNKSLIINSINSFTLYIDTMTLSKVSVNIYRDSNDKKTWKVNGFIKSETSKEEEIVPTLAIYSSANTNAEKYEVLLRNGTCVLRNTTKPTEEYLIDLLNYGAVKYISQKGKNKGEEETERGYDLEKFCKPGNNDLTVYTKDGKEKKCQLKYTTGFNVDNYLVATFTDLKST